jgi:phage tail sheath gpL-like
VTITSILDTSDKRPGSYTRVSLGVGLRASGASTRHVELFGNKTSTGTATVGVEYDVFSEDDARTLFGAGSELFLMVKEAIAAWPGITLKCIAITESAGAAASGTLVYVTTATASGTGYVTCLGEEIEFPIAVGDTATAMGDNAVLAINAKTDWPITAANVTGTVTCTAKNKGPRGNFLAVRGRLSSGTGSTVTPPASGYLTSGATSDDPQTALDALAGVQRRYLVAPYSDATQLAKFQTHVDAQDEPEVGHRKRLVFASLDTLANTTTLATGRNFARASCAWLYNSDLPPSMLAAGHAARLAAGESTDTAHNFNGEVIPGLKPHYLVSNRPTSTQLKSALNNGITPLASADDGSVYIVRSITTRSRDALANADYRVLDTCKVSVPDEAADRFELAFADRFSTFKASQDPDDGEPSAPGVVTPSMCRDLSFEITSQMEEEGLLESGSAERLKDQIAWELSTTSAGRFNGVIPLDVIEWASQFCTNVLQVG